MGKCISACSNYETKNYTNNSYSVGACSTNEETTTNENSYSICLSFPNHISYSFFAVFQGFNGKHAAKYLANNLLNTLNKLDTLDDDELVIKTINTMDDQFLKLKNANMNNSGSTFIFALIQHPNNNSPTANQSVSTESECKLNNYSSNSSSGTSIASLKLPSCYEIYNCRIFWVGDCRAVIIKRNGKYFESLTNDHCTQIQNKTELSMCFGYYSMKNNKNKYGQNMMKCVTECKQFSFGSNETLILFSSGLTEYWYDNQMVKYYNTIYEKYRNIDDTMTNSLRYLIKKCIDDGTKTNQNISAVSIKFH